MRIYLTDIKEYLELGEKPSFEYNSILFQYDDLMMSRTCDLTIPRTTNNDAVLGHPLISGIHSTVIDSVHEAVFAGEGVNVKGTLYVSECTPDGYECTFTYGDLLGADALDTDLSELLSSTSVYVKLASGSTSLTTLIPTSLSPMVCMDYSVELEASEDNYATGYTSADMHCVIYSTTLGLWLAMGEGEAWYSSDGVTFTSINSSALANVTWHDVKECSTGELVACGLNSSGLMVVAVSTSAKTWTRRFTSASTSETSPTSGFKRCLAVNAGSSVVCVCGSSRDVAVFSDGDITSTTLPYKVALIYTAMYYSPYIYVFIRPFTSSDVEVVGYRWEVSTSSTPSFEEYGLSSYDLPWASLGAGGIAPVYATSYYWVYALPDTTSIYYLNGSPTTWEEWGVSFQMTGLCYSSSARYFVGVSAEGATYYWLTSASSATSGGSCGDQDLNAVAVDDDGSTWVAVGDSGAIFYSTDHGVTWTATRAVVSTTDIGFAPMPCVNLAWLCYTAAAKCGYTLNLSESGVEAAPYVYVMLPSCLDSYGLEVSEGGNCYLKYNLPDVSAIDIITLWAALMGEAMFVNGSTIQFFNYDFAGEDLASYDLSEFGSLIHAVTTDGAQSNLIQMDAPDEATGECVALSYTTNNSTLGSSRELYSSDISGGASDGGILRVSNIKIDTDEDDEGNITYEITREGDPTLCLYDSTNSQMLYACDGKFTSFMQKRAVDLEGVTNLEAIHDTSVTITVTLIIPLFRFMAFTYSTLVVIEGIPYCVRSATWSDGACECELVKIPQSLI